MKEEYVNRIRENYLELVQLNVTDSFLNEFQGILSSDKIEQVKNVPERTNKARHFWIELLKSPNNAYPILITALNKAGQTNFMSLLDPKNSILEDTVPQVHNSPNYIISHRAKPLEVVVKMSKDFKHVVQQNEHISVYNTKSRNRGLVKIINILNFNHNMCRTGSQFDVSSLNSLFKQMGLVVETNDRDLTAQEINEEVEKFVTNPYLQLSDIAIMVIMTHGSRDHSKGKEYLEGHDGALIYKEDVEKAFSNDRCPFMQNKPKILIFQTCRGKNLDYGVSRVQSDTALSPSAPLPKISTLSDLLVINSTLLNYESHRDIYVGTWYIQLMCEVFMEHSHNTHVEDMCKITQKRLQEQRSGNHSMQTSEIRNIAFNLCYLNPGIYLNDDGIIKHFNNKERAHFSTD
ncbi:PREDICTED: caspase Dronc-like [Nicrophorus vespilloides]|uniref:Caspase Dronc-like n=1 Tax=Nicrophorus vespilloides TaxID=110193 RepID=A0ABM1ND31_NICVS|nr:PREDICTED: caspase Dronc-like [Nicrophorus vespilloides]